MYNSVQYSVRVWLTSALAVPHIYLLYYGLNYGAGSLPVQGYLELLILCVLLSFPVWFFYLLTLDVICRTDLSIKVKKALGLISFETALLLLFTAVIHFGSRHLSWFAYFDFIAICCFTAGVCTTFYKLQPLKGKQAEINNRKYVL